MNVYNHPFDDQTQIRIKLETFGVFEIFRMITSNKLSVVWSFILDYENSLNPYHDRQVYVKMLSSLASECVMTSEDIREKAKDYESEGIKPRDALHLSCALKSRADCFITCDDKLIKKALKLKIPMMVCNPSDFITKGV